MFKAAQLASTALCFVIGWSHLTGEVSCADESFLDNFMVPEPTSSDRSPVTWKSIGSDIVVENGSLIIGNQRWGLGGALVEGFRAGDISVETQFRILEGTQFGIALRLDEKESDCYLAELNIASAELMRCGSHQLSNSVSTDFDPRQEDVVMRMQISGDQLNVWAWPADETQPGKPLLTTRDSRYSEGVVGIFVNSADQRRTKAAVRYFKVSEPGLRGDFNDNGQLDADDMDLLSKQVRSLEGDLEFDLNDDGQIDQLDRSQWINVIANSFVGDSNLDGTFDVNDLVTVFIWGKYMTSGEAGWGEGDWNGDGHFDEQDFIAAYIVGGYLQPARLAISSVPEPSSLTLLVLGLLALTRRLR